MSPSSEFFKQRELTLQAALEFAELGIRVFPLKAGGKDPLLYRGFHKATTTKRIICSWFTGKNLINIGLRTGSLSGLCVVDVDVRQDANGFDALSELESQLGTLPDTAKVHTLSGQHRYFSWTGGDTRTWRKLGDRLEFFANGGYVVAPPSVVEGKQYRFDEGSGFCWDQVAELPPAWFEKARKQHTTHISSDITVQADVSPLLTCSGVIVGNEEQIIVGTEAASPQPRQSKAEVPRSDSWKHRHLAHWRDWEFRLGHSFSDLNTMAGALNGFRATDREAEEITSHIIQLAVQEERWHCTRTPEEFHEGVLGSLQGLRQSQPKRSGELLRKLIPIPQGIIDYLLQIPELKARAFLWLVYILAQWNPGEKVALPRKTIAPYLLSADPSLKSLDQAFESTRYLITRAYNPDSVRCKLALLTNRTQGNHPKNPSYVSGEIWSPDFYKPIFPPDWLVGPFVAQAIAEQALGLPPVTPEFLKMIWTPIGYGDREVEMA